MTRLLLNMIVKNEAAIIERCLKSVMPIICGAVIADTGSTDDTEQIISRLFHVAGKPVEIVHTTFENFSQARNFALRAARASSIPYDYIFFADADHQLTVRHPLPQLTAEAYALLQRTPTVEYYNVRLLHRSLRCEYIGATHECIRPDNGSPVALGNMWFDDAEDGANRVDKYVRDIRLLTEELRGEPLNSRAAFYLLQSLQGAGMIQRAFDMTTIFLQMEGSLPEERYWATYERGHYAELLDLPLPETVAYYQAAYELRPHRAEPLARIAQLYRKAGSPHTALLYARQAALLPKPTTEVLPVSLATYEWMALDEYLTAAAKANNIVEARVAARKLAKRTVPDEQRARIEKNCNAVLKGKI